MKFTCSDAQISPPGLGAGHMAGWFALGLRQDLDTMDKKESVSYIGYGFKSNPDNYNPYFKSAIMVINQEFYHRFRPHWQYSFAISYRRQDEYMRSFPYEHTMPDHKQELRLYGRYSYMIKKSNFRLTATIRQEYRKFFAPHFTSWKESTQLRSRLRLQGSLNLNKSKTQKITGSAESLFSISRESEPENEWSDFTYGESRFCFYYSLNPKNTPVTFSIGYMNNKVIRPSAYTVHYLAFDIIWDNPFELLTKSTDKMNHKLE